MVFFLHRPNNVFTVYLSKLVILNDIVNTPHQLQFE